MARKPLYDYNGWTLTERDGAACASRISKDGKRQRVRLGVEIEPLEGAKSALIAFVDANDKTTIAVTGSKIADIWKLYRDDRVQDGARASNFDWLWPYLADYYGHLAPADLTREMHRQFAAGMEAKGYSAWTIWHPLAKLKSCMKWAVDNHVIDRTPLLWNISKPGNKKIVVADDGVVKLLDACVSHHTRLFVLLALCSAARHTAILELTWDRVNFETNEIDFTVGKPVRSVLNKGHQKQRAVVPFGPVMRETLLAEYNRQTALAASDRVSHCPYVVQYSHKRLLSARKAFTKARVAAGLPDTVTPHTLRHTAGTWANRVANVERAARLLGHADSRTTEAIYIQVDTEPLRPVVVSIEDRLAEARLKRKTG